MGRQTRELLFAISKSLLSLTLVFQGIQAYADTPIGSFIYSASTKPGDGLVKFDATSFKQLKTIPLPNATSPYVLGVDPSQASVFVERESAFATVGKRTIDVVSTQTDTITRTIDLPLPSGYAGRISELNFSRDGSKAFVSLTENQSVLVLSGDLTRQLGVINSGGQTPWKGTLSPDGAWLYVPNFSSPSIGIVNTASNVLQGNPSSRPWSNGSPLQIVVSPDGQTIYVSLSGEASNSYRGELLALQPNAAHDGFTLVKHVTFPTTINSSIQVTADGKKLYVLGGGAPATAGFYIVDTDTFAVTTKNIASLQYSGKFAITQDGMRVILGQSSFNTPALVSIDPASDQVSATTNWNPSTSDMISYTLVDTRSPCR